MTDTGTDTETKGVARALIHFLPVDRLKPQLACVGDTELVYI